jgi:polysaccharide export outer membrane protein
MNVRDAAFFVSLALVLALTGPGQAGAGSAAAADESTAPGQGYILGPQDVVEVELLGQGDFHVRAPIGTDGAILVPYLGKVAAADKTCGQLSDDIAQALEAGGFYSHPVLSVEIVSYASRYVTVLGEVGSPGLVPIDRAYHLSDILARVGGVKDGGADYLVVRTAGAVEHRYLISALATGGVSDDPLVSPGDKIFSPKAALFYVSGQVKAPGAYPMADGLTVRMAIGRGGGVSDLGTDRAVKVRDPTGKLVHLRLDDKIAPGDVIVVGERLF